MQLDDLTGQVHDQLLAAATLGDERTRQIATALADTARAAVRVAILDALSTASAELTAALHDAAGKADSPAIGLQLDGELVRFTVTAPPPEPPAPAAPDDGDTSARITLRLSEALKSEIEQAAGRAALSVNGWLVRAAQQALRDGPDQDQPPRAGYRSGGAHRLSGWVTG
jgi:hypothetical protein